MKKRMIEFACPNCGAKFYLCRDTYLTRDDRSAQETHLKDGTFFAHQCSQCKTLFNLEYPLIYKDPVQKFSIILSSSVPAGWQGTGILTKNSAQFLKAYTILSRGLPLKKSLEIWSWLEKREQKPCRLTDADKEGIVWFECGHRMLGIDFKKWDSDRNLVQYSSVKGV